MTKLNIIYASEMGTAMAVAEDVEVTARNKGIDAELSEMDDVSLESLQDMKRVMVVISSTGDGDVPMMGEEFWAAIEKAEIDLSKMNYSVCALGNRMYFNFCGAGKKIDKRLSELGATCVVNRHECDDGIDGWDTWAEETIIALGY
tara:strand:+ start:985 stop:1422 length:438 start_codon:yes stop_codon:yes gene_type:complete